MTFAIGGDYGSHSGTAVPGWAIALILIGLCAVLFLVVRSGRKRR
jgi:F0F1-type ATP synthase assembly protein I